MCHSFHLRLVPVVLATGAALLAAAPASADDGACAKIAQAKYAQWLQPAMMRDLVTVYADGSRKEQEAIFTQNTMYLRHGAFWATGTVTIRRRNIPSPEMAAHDLGLVDCGAGEQTEEAGQKATVYAYRSDAFGYESESRMWISDSTGLPLKAEMTQKGAKAGAAVEISASYRYGDDVKVPLAAERADFMRRERGTQFLRAIQGGRPSTSE